METEMKFTAGFWVFALLGWALFVGTIWYEHRAAGPDAVPFETQKAMDHHGFSEGTVSSIPPPHVIHDTVQVPGAERIVYVQLEAKPTEAKPPEVQPSPESGE